MKKIAIIILSIASLSAHSKSFTQDEVLTAVCMSEITSNEQAARYVFFIETFKQAKTIKQKNNRSSGFMGIFNKPLKHCDKKGLIAKGGEDATANLMFLFSSMMSMRQHALLDPTLKTMAR